MVYSYKYIYIVLMYSCENIITDGLYPRRTAVVAIQDLELWWRKQEFFQQYLSTILLKRN